jgi:2-oxoglutarate ferredoxin oxidoreductase subunit alpha
LAKKWETAKTLIPAPEFYQENYKGEVGLIFFGTTTYAAIEAMDLMAEAGVIIDSMRVKAFPFHTMVSDFIDKHEQVIVVEQNRDAQFRSLLMNELNINPSKLISVLNYDGMPITAHVIQTQIANKLSVETNSI